MFEIVGKSPRPTKHINVTEARATFASMLSDLESHYVITKNNKPKRVIINFDEYQQWLHLLEAEEASRGSKDTKLEAKTPADAETDLAGRMIRHDHAVHGEAVPPMTATQSDEESGTVMREPAISRAAVETDYFNSTSGEDFASEVERLLPEPEDEAVPSTQPDDKRLAQQDTPVQSDSVRAEAPEIKITEAKDKDFIGDVAKTPEEEEYYRRYRKLYESFYTPNTATISNDTDSCSSLENTTEKSVASTKIEEHFGLNAKDNSNILDSKHDIESVQTRAEMNDATVTDNENVQNSSVRDPITWDYGFADVQEKIESVQNEDAPPAYDATTPLRQESNTEPVQSKGEKLPSLQELLKDLEKQRLSAEDGEQLKTEDIDEIINRITSD